MFMDIPMTTINENLLESPVHSSLFEAFEPASNNKEKNYYIRGKFATIEMVNNNKRFYPRALWEREVEKYQDEIKNGTINTLMEWDHPADRLEVDPSQAIGKITKLWIEGNYVMGEAVIFDTPKAEVLKSMIKHGVQISVSSRARGRVDNAGVVQEFNLITFDFVAKPSDKSATMYGLYEKYLNATNEAEGNMIHSRGQYVSIPSKYKFITLDKDGIFNAHITKPKNRDGLWVSKENIRIGSLKLDSKKLDSVLNKGETARDFRIRETKEAIWSINGTINIERALTTVNAYGHYYAIKTLELDEGINQMSESDTQNITNDAVLESLVRQVRTKDSIIDDLKEEINMLRESRSNESAGVTVKFDATELTFPSDFKWITFDPNSGDIFIWKDEPKWDEYEAEFDGGKGKYIGSFTIDDEKQYEMATQLGGEGLEDLAKLCKVQLKPGVNIDAKIKNLKKSWVKNVKLDRDEFSLNNTKKYALSYIGESQGIGKYSKQNKLNENTMKAIVFRGAKYAIPEEYNFVSIGMNGLVLHRAKPKFDFQYGEINSSGELVIGEFEVMPEYAHEAYGDGDEDFWDLMDEDYDYGNKIIGIAMKKSPKDWVLELKGEVTDITKFIANNDFIESEYEMLIDELNESQRRKDLGRRYSRMNESRSRLNGTRGIKSRRRLNEGDITNTVLDNRHDFYHDYNTHRGYEDADFHYRRAGERLSQTHRHQDHSLLRDTDPASSTYSGEAEYLRIAKLLQQTFGRDNVVGSRLDKDIDTGLTVRGYAAGIEEEPRFAENGLDFIQRTLSESYDTKEPNKVNRRKN